MTTVTARLKAIQDGHYSGHSAVTLLLLPFRTTVTARLKAIQDGHYSGHTKVTVVLRIARAARLLLRHPESASDAPKAEGRCYYLSRLPAVPGRWLNWGRKASRRRRLPGRSHSAPLERWRSPFQIPKNTVLEMLSRSRKWLRSVA